MSLLNSRVLITGANGFIGKNLVQHMAELPNVSVIPFLRSDDPITLPKIIAQVDAVVHLAGENRPNDDNAFMKVNAELTFSLCRAIGDEYRSTGRYVPLVLASSAQAECSNSYGHSKLVAEEIVKKLSIETGNPSVIFRLPGVFGKWCRPNYNSVVATFCHNIARELPIQIKDPTISLELVYVDDVITALLDCLEAPISGYVYANVRPQYRVNLGELADQILAFGNCRYSLLTEQVGSGFKRALYATYVSYLPNKKFAYLVPQYKDSRGVFVEMLKTVDSGQFSYFTANPGITRGGHYHHTKTEKFLVVKGKALFRFKHLLTNELVEIQTCGESPQVVESIPGWLHDITNIGNDEIVVMLWANENFDRQKPDTVTRKI